MLFLHLGVKKKQLNKRFCRRLCHNRQRIYKYTEYVLIFGYDRIVFHIVILETYILNKNIKEAEEDPAKYVIQLMFY